VGHQFLIVKGGEDHDVNLGSAPPEFLAHVEAIAIR
jgi:hypothetical protein